MRHARRFATRRLPRRGGCDAGAWWAVCVSILLGHTNAGSRRGHRWPGRIFPRVAEVRTPIFLDCSSGEPLLPEARDAWLLAASSGWGDPQRLHRPGRLAAQALDSARARVAAHVGARPDEVVFTGPLAPSAQAAVAGLVRGRRRVGEAVVTSTVEHSDRKSVV